MRTLLCLLFLSACGYTDEGDGSGTLEVRAEVLYRADNDRSELTVEVEKGGVGMNDATVELSEDEGSTYTVPVLNQGNETGFYRSEISGYHRKMALSVKGPNAEDDWLEAKLEGPGRHRLVEPANGASLEGDEARKELEVKWATDDGIKADEVLIEIDAQGGGPGQTPEKPEDEGSFTIEGASLADGPNDIRVMRTNKVNLAGGTGLSFFKINYRVENEVVVE